MRRSSRHGLRFTRTARSSRAPARPRPARARARSTRRWWPRSSTSIPPSITLVMGAHRRDARRRLLGRLPRAARQSEEGRVRYTHGAARARRHEARRSRRASLTVVNGVVSGGGKSVSYAELVKGQQLDLEDPGHRQRWRRSIRRIRSGIIEPRGPQRHRQPAAQADRAIQGHRHRSFERPGIRDIVTGKAQYSGDISVPGMLHARMVRPATLGVDARLRGQARSREVPER